ncbi:uncharacterized protein [Antedon mediterranea]|uniref:uncharacterized protein n=1 Tax=Antedon mediterranea TaxID=105859 RepID=UPI003AF7E33A
MLRSISFLASRIHESNIMSSCSSSQNKAADEIEETDDGKSKSKPVKMKRNLNVRRRNSALKRKRNKKDDSVNTEKITDAQIENGETISEQNDNTSIDLSYKTQEGKADISEKNNVTDVVLNGSDDGKISEDMVNGTSDVDDCEIEGSVHSSKDGDRDLTQAVNQPPMKRRKPMRVPYSEPVDLTCQVCGELLPNATELTVHIRQHNSTNTSNMHTCNMCGRILSSQSSLDRHMLVHSGERPFKCPICKMAFTTNGNMNRHLRTHEKENEAAAATINILQAGGQGRQRKRVPSKRFLEQDDDYMPLKKKGLSPIKKQKPIMSVPRETVEISLQAGDLNCPVCHKTFLCKYGVLTHMEMHPHMSLRCSICSAVFKNHKGLRVHLQMVHEKVMKQASTSLPAGFQDLACLHVDFSSKSFPRVAQKWCEENARRCGSSRIKFVCKECDKAFPCRAALELHANTHNLTDAADQRDVFVKTHDVDTEQNKFLALFSLQPTISKVKQFIGNPAPSSKKSTTTSNKFMQASPRKKPLQWHNFSKDTMEMTSKAKTGSVQMYPVRSFKYAQPGVSKISPVKGSTISTNIVKAFPVLKMAPSPPPLQKIKVKVEQSKEEVQVMDLSPNMTASTGDEGNAIEPQGIPEEAGSERLELSESIDEEKKSTHTCKYCNKVFPFASTLKIHMRNHMGLTPYQCMLCTYASADKSTLVRHMRTHSGERPFSCGICEFPFTTKANCERHIRKKHHKDDKADIDSCIVANENPKLPEERNTFTAPESMCNICGRSFKFFRDLQNHMRVHEKCDDKPYICSRCPSGFASKNNCMRHITKRHPEVRAEDVESLMIIQEPSKPESDAPSEDVSEQPLDFSMKADKQKAMISLASTSQILGNSESKIPQNGLIIPQATIGKLRFKRVYHKFYSRAVDALVCPHCSLAFSRSTMFKRHIRSHTAERPFRCYYCSAAFTVKENLDKHMLKRHNAIPEAPFQSFIPKVTTPMQHKLLSKTPSKRTFKPREKPSVREWVDLNSTINEERNVAFVQSSNPPSIASFESDPGGDLTSISKMLAATNTHNFQSLLEARLLNPPAIDIPQTGIPLGHIANENKIENPIIKLQPSAESVPSSDKLESNAKTEVKKDGSEDDKKGRVRYKFVKKLSCPYCPRMFPWISSLRRHLLVHSGLKPYQCCTCTATFSTKSNCERHMVRKHNITQDEATKLTTVNPFNCEICTKISFNRIDLLESHYQENHPNDDLPSYFARAKQVMQIPLEELMNKLKPKADDGNQQKDKSLETEKENAEENIADDVIQHPDTDLDKSDDIMYNNEEVNPTNDNEECVLNMAESVAATFDDESKAIEFDQEIGIDMHVEEGEMNKDDDESDVMKLNDTDENQLDSKPLDAPMSVNGRKRRKLTCTHICKQCKKKFKNSATLRRHYRVHTLEHPFKCSICSSSFTTKFNCQRHMIKIHGKQREDVFKVMELSETEQNELIREATSQISAANHEDDIKDSEDVESVHSSNDTDHASSEKSFNSLPAKIIHSPPGKQVTEDLRRKFSCDVCQKKFLSSRDLKRHDRTHTGERPFVCTDCNRNFGFKHSLVRHQRTHNHSNWILQKSSTTFSADYNEVETQMENTNKSAANNFDIDGTLSNSQDIYLPSTLQRSTMLMSPGNNGDLLEDGESLMSRIDDTDIIKNLLGIQDSSMIDEMLDSADSAAKLLGV